MLTDVGFQWALFVSFSLYFLIAGVCYALRHTIPVLTNSGGGR